jgi:hypothetical protein
VTTIESPTPGTASRTTPLPGIELDDPFRVAEELIDDRADLPPLAISIGRGPILTTSMNIILIIPIG